MVVLFSSIWNKEVCVEEKNLKSKSRAHKHVLVLNLELGLLLHICFSLCRWKHKSGVIYRMSDRRMLVKENCGYGEGRSTGSKLKVYWKWVKLKPETWSEKRKAKKNIEEEIVPKITGLIGKRQTLCRFTLLCMYSITPFLPSLSLLFPHFTHLTSLLIHYSH